MTSAVIPSAMNPHPFDEDPMSNQRNCRCGYATSWRYHQPWWWRWTHRGNWRS